MDIWHGHDTGVLLNGVCSVCFVGSFLPKDLFALPIGISSLLLRGTLRILRCRVNTSLLILDAFNVVHHTCIRGTQRS